MEILAHPNGPAAYAFCLALCMKPSGVAVGGLLAAKQQREKQQGWSELVGNLFGQVSQKQQTIC